MFPSRLDSPVSQKRRGMRIVHIITRMILGGAQENTLYTVLDLVERFRDNVTLITGPAEGPEGSLLDRARRENVDLRLVPTLRRKIDPKRDWQSYRTLSALLRELRPDVVHTHSSKAGIVGRVAAWKCRIPAIVHTIHGLPFHPYEKWWKNQFYIAVERWAAKRCDRLISVADAMTRQAVAAGVAAQEKFVTIFSGMDVEPFLNPPRQSAAVRRDLGMEVNDLVVGKIGRLFELKGHDDVIDAVGPLFDKYATLKVLFVGDGAWRNRLEERVRAMARPDRFVFTGLVEPERIPELISCCDVIVHASYREGLARVLPQALIAGRPVVSYDIDGAREVVLPGRTGFLVPPRQPAGLSAALDQLLADPALRRNFGQAGRDLFTEQFRHEHMTEQIRRVYEDVLQSKAQAVTTMA